MTTWQHPTLGEFEYDGSMAWRGTVESQVFTRFPGSSSRINMLIEADEAEDKPEGKILEVAMWVNENCEKLVADGMQAFIDDFNSVGPDSGMWWHGDLDAVMEYMVEDGYHGKVESAGDLYQLMEKPGIVVQSRGYGYKNPCAIIGFESIIDIEHGVGILTDGIEVIGLGYRMDVGAYKTHRR